MLSPGASVHARGGRPRAGPARRGAPPRPPRLAASRGPDLAERPGPGPSSLAQQRASGASGDLNMMLWSALMAAGAAQLGGAASSAVEAVEVGVARLRRLTIEPPPPGAHGLAWPGHHGTHLCHARYLASGTSGASSRANPSSRADPSYAPMPPLCAHPRHARTRPKRTGRQPGLQGRPPSLHCRRRPACGP